MGGDEAGRRRERWLAVLRGIAAVALVVALRPDPRLLVPATLVPAALLVYALLAILVSLPGLWVAGIRQAAAALDILFAAAAGYVLDPSGGPTLALLLATASAAAGLRGFNVSTTLLLAVLAAASGLAVRHLLGLSTGPDTVPVLLAAAAAPLCWPLAIAPAPPAASPPPPAPPPPPRASDEQAALETALAVVQALEAGHPTLRGRSAATARWVELMGRELGLDASTVEAARLAAQVHDVGLVAVPCAALEHSGPLSAADRAAWEEHPRVSARIIDAFNHSKLVLEGVYSHHEHWDGTGFPRRVGGTKIPIVARLICVADALHSLLVPHPDRPALAPREALQQIMLGAGREFDPSVVQALLAVVEREGEGILRVT